MSYVQYQHVFFSCLFVLCRLLGKVKQMKLPGEVYFMAADRLMLLRPTDRRQLPHGCKMLLDLIEDGEDPSVNKALE